MPGETRPSLAAVTRGRVLFGGDYNPEQWPEEVWHEDVRLMREAGVTTVTLGVFSWAKLEPRPGAREFGWLDTLMDLMHASGVGVVLALSLYPLCPPHRLHMLSSGLSGDQK
ncbi:beta-galactosidase, partial [Streptomyces scabiei]|uniref:beta-galactosidase n=1 Tax=Streptomyces scabiei TaxID=1930 RepID=UPI0029B56D67